MTHQLEYDNTVTQKKNGRKLVANVQLDSIVPSTIHPIQNDINDTSCFIKKSQQVTDCING